ncbi:hypothetical protein TSOC_002822 [Tetrabaena socialis]|uniref:TIR domain-containing protein n=1 Tax=Tetrabaena socialis TaxID=47790 RepID=A0A2J8AD24_9CHLO|nr:hypothetical protein TSOC_002822 [Tetrabaena socialis]|eukprot:PNH10425.1 hypothetical protein TSOC_002822 [Tetrabaena socialis]
MDRTKLKILVDALTAGDDSPALNELHSVVARATSKANFDASTVSETNLLQVLLQRLLHGEGQASDPGTCARERKQRLQALECLAGDDKDEYGLLYWPSSRSTLMSVALGPQCQAFERLTALLRSLAAAPDDHQLENGAVLAAAARLMARLLLRPDGQYGQYAVSAENVMQHGGGGGHGSRPSTSGQAAGAAGGGAGGGGAAAGQGAGGAAAGGSGAHAPVGVVEAVLVGLAEELRGFLTAAAELLPVAEGAAEGGGDGGDGGGGGGGTGGHVEELVGLVCRCTQRFQERLPAVLQHLQAHLQASDGNGGDGDYPSDLSAAAAAAASPQGQDMLVSTACVAATRVLETCTSQLAQRHPRHHHQGSGAGSGAGPVTRAAADAALGDQTSAALRILATILRAPHAPLHARVQAAGAAVQALRRLLLTEWSADAGGGGGSGGGAGGSGSVKSDSIKSDSDAASDASASSASSSATAASATSAFAAAAGPAAAGAGTLPGATHPLLLHDATEAAQACLDALFGVLADPRVVSADPDLFEDEVCAGLAVPLSELRPPHPNPLAAALDLKHSLVMAARSLKSLVKGVPPGELSGGQETLLRCFVNAHDDGLKHRVATLGGTGARQSTCLYDREHGAGTWSIYDLPSLLTSCQSLTRTAVNCERLAQHGLLSSLLEVLRGSVGDAAAAAGAGAAGAGAAPGAVLGDPLLAVLAARTLFNMAQVSGLHADLREAGVHDVLKMGGLSDPAGARALKASGAEVSAEVGGLSGSAAAGAAAPRASGTGEAAGPRASTTGEGAGEAAAGAAADEAAAREADGAGGPVGAPPLYDVFLSHKRTDARDFARALWNLLVSNGYTAFLDFEYKQELGSLGDVVGRCSTFIFVLTDNVFKSEWCIKELKAAVLHNVNIVLLIKDGARWPDAEGNPVCDFPPPHLLRTLPPEVQPVFTRKPVVHNDEYYRAFVEALFEKVLEGMSSLMQRNAQLESLLYSASSSGPQPPPNGHAHSYGSHSPHPYGSISPHPPPPQPHHHAPAAYSGGNGHSSNGGSFTSASTSAAAAAAAAGSGGVLPHVNSGNGLASNRARISSCLGYLALSSSDVVIEGLGGGGGPEGIGSPRPSLSVGGGLPEAMPLQGGLYSPRLHPLAGGTLAPGGSASQVAVDNSPRGAPRRPYLSQPTVNGQPPAVEASGGSLNSMQGGGGSGGGGAAAGILSNGVVLPPLAAAAMLHQQQQHQPLPPQLPAAGGGGAGLAVLGGGFRGAAARKGRA